MKIIDAHLHFMEHDHFEKIARAAGHENTAEHLAKKYAELGFLGGIVMGNRAPSDLEYHYPKMLNYCVGMDSHAFSREELVEQLPFLNEHLKRKECVGIKLYPGYNYFYVYEDFLAPIYELAVKYDKPVAVHTGLTATDQALLKYSHPSTLDEAAVKFRKVQFVMCHFGDPYFADAAAVLAKNANVAADLSGMLAGKIPDFTAFLEEKRFYVERLKGWLAYLGAYDRFLFGTDWPLASLEDYIAYTKALIPEKHWEKVFYENAERIYNPRFSA